MTRMRFPRPGFAYLHSLKISPSLGSINGLEIPHSGNIAHGIYVYTFIHIRTKLLMHNITLMYNSEFLTPFLLYVAEGV